MTEARIASNVLVKRIDVLVEASGGACRYGMGLREYGPNPPLPCVTEVDCRRRIAALTILLDAARAAEAYEQAPYGVPPLG